MGCASGCAGASGSGHKVSDPAVPRAHPQVVQPTAGMQAPAVTPSNPIGDPNAHAPSLKQVRAELKLELVAVRKSSATYINPLPYVTCCGTWERTDQGVDATMPVGAPIVAPSRVKILGLVPDWYAGQPLVYFELLAGPQAGQIQFVAEQITSIAPVGSFLNKGAVIARFAPSGTAIEYGWSTINGVTLAKATTGYEEGQVTPAGVYMRNWLNSLGAKAGPS
ncbi:MAG: hypothetical protein ACJ764_10785 [Solirubrobacteraceae bacterium]